MLIVILVQYLNFTFRRFPLGTIFSESFHTLLLLLSKRKIKLVKMEVTKEIIVN